MAILGGGGDEDYELELGDVIIVSEVSGSSLIDSGKLLGVGLALGSERF